MAWERIMFWNRRRTDADFAEEVAAHIALETERLEQSGMTRADARAAAHRAFGNTTAVREQFHEHEAAGRLEWLAHDLQYGLRALRRSPGFTAVAVASLALGIGANITMFSAIDALLLRTPEHVRNAAQVHRVYFATPDPDGVVHTSTSSAYRTYVALRDNANGFEAVAAFHPRAVSSGRGAEARSIDAELVTSGFFPLLGAEPYLGRFFLPDEARNDRGHVAVLGYDQWRVRYAGDSTVIGRTIDVAGTPYVIVGVAPPRFNGVDIKRVDLWLPLGFATTFMGPRAVDPTSRSFWLTIIARRRANIPERQVATEATSLFRDAWRDAPRYEDTHGKAHVLLGPIVAARGPVPDPNANVSLWVAVVSVLVLLIACANVANLLLLRGLARARETALRLSLGASHWRIVRQSLVEGGLLAVAGAVCAVVLSHWSANALNAFLLPQSAVTRSLEPRLLCFTAVVTVITGVLATVAPALVAMRRNLAPILGAGRTVGYTQRLVVQRLLVGGQVALATMLLVGAGLFVASLRNVRAIDLGLDVAHILYVSVDLGPQRNNSSDGASLAASSTYQAMLEAVRRLPGVASATLSAGEPLSSAWGISLARRGAPPPAVGSRVPLGRAVGTDYFETMGTALRRGRLFTAADHAAGAHVAIVDEATAKSFWPNADPLDPCVWLGSDRECTRIVGVVANTVLWDVTGDVSSVVYVPLESAPVQAVTMLEVRTTGDPALMVSAVRNAVSSVSAALPWADIRPLSEQLAPQFKPWRIGASMFAAYGLLALCLAAIGLYGLLSYVVAQRAHEIGVRKALGAAESNVVRMVLRWALGMTVVGLASGIVIALMTSRFVASQLYGISSRNPIVIAASAASLLVVAAVASLAPAIRAIRVDPMESMRAE